MPDLREISILHVEDSEDDAELIARELRKAFKIKHKVVKSDAELREALKSKWDIVLSDFSMPGFTGLEALQIIRQMAPDLPFVFVSGTIGEERAVDAIKAGANDYVIKDSMRRLVPVVQRILNESEARARLTESERNLAMMRARYRLFAENSTDIIALLDEKSIIQYISPSVEVVLGKHPNEMTGNPGFPGIIPSDAATLAQSIAQSLETGNPFQATFRIQHKNGEWLWLETHGRTISNPLTGLREIITVTRDVTARMSAETRVREQATLLDVAHDGIVVRDLQHRVLFWNKGAERIYGWKSAEVMGKSSRELLYVTPADFDAAFRQLLGTGEFRGELRQVSRTQGELIVNASWTLVRDERGEPKSVLCINSDITEQRKLETQFLRAQRMESIGNLASGIAHDLNNALTPIIMAVGLLQSDNLTEEQAELLETIRLSSRRGADMVRQILSFARGSEGVPTTVNMRQMLNDIDKIMRDTFPKQITTSVHLTEEPWPIRADITQIHQVLMNLVVNARDAMEKGGRLIVSAKNRVLDKQYALMSGGIETGKYLEISVEDTGMGIPPDVQEKIFDPFFTTKAPGKGTGLGLSTAQSIVRAQGGFIHVYSEAGRGTQFQVYLPAQTEQGAPPETISETSEPPRGNGECILLVDDEKSILDITAKTLVDFGYRVIKASDGAEATALYAGHKEDIDLVFTDVMMPVLDGPGFIRVIRKLNVSIPIITASGLEGNAKLRQLEGDENLHFVAKPYTAETLLVLLQKALQQTKKIS